MKWLLHKHSKHFSQKSSVSLQSSILSSLFTKEYFWNSARCSVLHLVYNRLYTGFSIICTPIRAYFLGPFCHAQFYYFLKVAPNPSLTFFTCFFFCWLIGFWFVRNPQFRRHQGDRNSHAPSFSHFQGFGPSRFLPADLRISFVKLLTPLHYRDSNPRPRVPLYWRVLPSLSFCYRKSVPLYDLSATM